MSLMVRLLVRGTVRVRLIQLLPNLRGGGGQPRGGIGPDPGDKSNPRGYVRIKRVSLFESVIRIA